MERNFEADPNPVAAEPAGPSQANNGTGVHPENLERLHHLHAQFDRAPHAPDASPEELAEQPGGDWTEQTLARSHLELQRRLETELERASDYNALSLVQGGAGTFNHLQQRGWLIPALSGVCQALETFEAQAEDFSGQRVLTRQQAARAICLPLHLFREELERNTPPTGTLPPMPDIWEAERILEPVLTLGRAPEAAKLLLQCEDRLRAFRRALNAATDPRSLEAAEPAESDPSTELATEPAVPQDPRTNAQIRREIQEISQLIRAVPIVARAPMVRKRDQLRAILNAREEMAQRNRNNASGPKPPG